MRLWVVGLGLFVLTACNFGINVNRPPQISNLSATPLKGVIPLEVAFSWTISDPEGAALRCLLDVDGDGTADFNIANCTSNSNRVHTYATAGNYLAKLRIEETNGLFAEQTLAIAATRNPSLSNFRAQPAFGEPPLATTFRWDISDPDSDVLTCKLDINNNGTFEYTLPACTSNSSQAHTYAAAGLYTALLQVEDPNGGKATATFVVNASNNQLPTVSNFRAEPALGAAPLNTTFRWSVGDPDGDTLQCQIDVENNGSFEYTLPACTSSTFQAHTYNQIGQYTARLRVSDSKGAAVTADTLVVVSANQNPNLSNFRAEPASGATPFFTTFRWSVTDPEVDAMLCQIDVQNDGVFEYSIPSCTSSSQQSHTYTVAGLYTARILVTDGKGGSATASIPLNVTQGSGGGPGFNIDLVFVGNIPDSQKNVFEQAAQRWQQLIVLDLTDVPGGVPANACSGGSQPVLSLIDDLVIEVRTPSIDGPGKILGRAGPCVVRDDAFLLPYFGIMEFDSADMGQLESDGSLLAVILHEMGHVLGFGTLWDFGRNLIQGKGSSNPVFVGTRAMNAYKALGGNGSVPLENSGGPGTRDSHWRETVFNNELMTGFINQGSNPLSRLTVASMGDLGYAVNEGLADSYTLGAPRAPLLYSRGEPWHILIKPSYVGNLTVEEWKQRQQR